MPRAATTADVFNAIAEPRRREIIDLLADRALPVSDIVAGIRLPQPAISKHLAVLREVGLVSATRDGRRRLYQLHAEELQAVHDWTRTFERYWTQHLRHIKEVAERRARTSTKAPPLPQPRPRKD